MYKILADNKELWSPDKDRVKIGDPTLTLALNSVGSLLFKIYPDHALYDDLKKLQTIVSVYQDADLLFRGRIFSDTVDMNKTKTVEVEGLLGYLNDSIVRPYTYSGTVRGYLQMLITQHNQQVGGTHVFNIGRVTVTDPNDYIVRSSSDFPNTWKEINDKLIDLLGGYLVIRYEKDGMYVDYLADFDGENTQGIAFGVNLLDLTKEIQSDEIATRIIPRGATIQQEVTVPEETDEEELDTASEDTETEETEQEEKRVDITSVNNGLDYIDDTDAVSKYGVIAQVVTWDDVNEPSILLSKARKWLTDAVKFTESMTLKALDLHLSDQQIEAFRLGQHITAISGPHNVNEDIILAGYTLNLGDPANCTIEANTTRASLTDSQIKAQSQAVTMVKEVQKNVDRTTAQTITALGEVSKKAETYVDTQLTGYYTKSETESKITVSETSLKSEMSQTYTTKSEVTTLVTDEVGTAIEESIKDTTSENSIGSAIEQKADAITSQVSESYVTVENMQSNIDSAKDYADQAVADFASNDETYLSMREEVSQLKQRADGFDFSITKTEGDISGNAEAIESAQNRLATIENHVTIDDNGDIVLSGTNSEFSARFAKDKLSFEQSGSEVAYLSNSKLHITDAEVLVSLVIGKFAFIPRANGSLDFKKVGD